MCPCTGYFTLISIYVIKKLQYFGGLFLLIVYFQQTNYDKILLSLDIAIFQALRII